MFWSRFTLEEQHGDSRHFGSAFCILYFFFLKKNHIVWINAQTVNTGFKKKKVTQDWLTHRFSFSTLSQELENTAWETFWADWTSEPLGTVTVSESTNIFTSAESASPVSSQRALAVRHSIYQHSSPWERVLPWFYWPKFLRLSLSLFISFWQATQWRDALLLLRSDVELHLFDWEAAVYVGWHRAAPGWPIRLQRPRPLGLVP